MTDPRRWLDSREEERSQHREVLGKAAPRRPLDAATRRKMRRNVVRLSATAAGASVFVSWLKALAAALGVSSLIAVATVATLVARDTLSRPTAARRGEPRPIAADARRSPLGETQPSAASAATPAIVAPVASAARSATSRTPRSLLAAPRRAVPLAASAAPARVDPPQPLVVTPTVEPVVDSLERERLMLEPARVALARDPHAAISAVERYQHMFSNGQLFAESEYIAVEALRRAGDRERAAARAHELMRRFPASVYATILRRQR
jgi:hypothetical protein